MGLADKIRDYPQEQARRKAEAESHARKAAEQARRNALSIEQATAKRQRLLAQRRGEAGGSLKKLLDEAGAAEYLLALSAGWKFGKLTQKYPTATNQLA